jgi:hypothetical protein
MEKKSGFTLAVSIYDKTHAETTYIYELYTVVTVLNIPTISNRSGFMFSNKNLHTS